MIEAAGVRVAAMSDLERQILAANFISFYMDGGLLKDERLGFPKHMHTTMSWRGVPAEKYPTDMWSYQEIISSSRPEVVLEIGVRQGGATLFFSDLLANLGGIVIGVDIDLSPVHPTVTEASNVLLVEGSSIDPVIASRVSSMCEGKRTMVILDSEHTYDHVKEELRLYAPLVGVWMSLIVEDTIVAGPERAAREFLEEQDGTFLLDMLAMRMMLSQAPNGMFVRVK